jgi:hypothetical protein
MRAASTKPAAKKGFVEAFASRAFRDGTGTFAINWIATLRSKLSENQGDPKLIA